MDLSPSPSETAQQQAPQVVGTVRQSPAINRKIPILVAGTLAVLLLVAAGAAAGVYWYSNYNGKEGQNVNQDGDTDPIIADQDDTNETIEDDEEIDPAQEHTCEKKTPKVQIEYLDEPVTVAQFDIFADGGDYSEEDYDYVKTGTVTSGMAGDNVDVTEYDVIVLKAHDDSSFVKLLANSSRSRMYEYQAEFRIPGSLGQEAFTANVISSGSGTQTLGLVGEDVDLMNLIKPFADAENDRLNVYKSDENVYFNYPQFVPSSVEDLDLGDPVDSICGYDIYLSENGMNYIESDDGYAYRMIVYPTVFPFTTVYTPLVPAVAWTEGVSVDQAYDYISIGGCGMVQELERTTLTPSQLRKVGEDTNGDAVYVPVNANEAYQRKVYDEDYIASEMWKYNQISEDNAAPFDYGTFLAYHPVFYWQDSYGRFIKFASEDFMMTGGCAKPAVYLYPETTSDIQVQVIPNGQLRFTLPDYPSSGWLVQANPSGEIFNYADGRTYNYLWWDSVAWNVDVPEEGFVVKKSDLSRFFDQTLYRFGLNSEETSDFKDYWIDKMKHENTPYFVVTFLFNDEVDQIAKLKFDIKPNVVMRMFMFYTPIESPIAIQPQQIPQMHREGFVVVEWGGAKMEQ
jgi:hypothetical protein